MGNKNSGHLHICQAFVHCYDNNHWLCGTRKRYFRRVNNVFVRKYVLLKLVSSAFLRI